VRVKACGSRFLLLGTANLSRVWHEAGRNRPAGTHFKTYGFLASLEPSNGP